MTEEPSERWQQVKAVFQAALDQPPARRSGFVAEACGGDGTLRREVESLLASHDRAQSFIESPALAGAGTARPEWLLHLVEAPPLETGTRFAQYEILASLGAGGMGQVYRARDGKLGRTVAIKLVGETVRERGATERILREAQTASALNHPHICTIYEVGDVNGRAYIAMEYVEGRPLKELIPDEGLPAEDVGRYGVQIADALAHAHDRGIVHRDLKSANVVVTPDGRAKVLDFGLAKRLPDAARPPDAGAIESVTETGLIAGTPSYMSPEVLRGQPATSRSDIWALGVLLYEMAGGRLPFTGNTAFEITSGVLREPPPPLPARVPESLRSIIGRCLVKEPGQRYQRASEVRAALETLPTTPMVPTRLASRLPWRRFLVGTALLALAAAAGYLGLERGWREAGTHERPVTIGVLPFQTLQGAEAVGFLGIGVPDAIISRLATIKRVRTRPTSAVLQYEQRRAVDPAQAGKALGVDYVLTGTIQQRGEQVRVSPQLVRVSDGTPLWGRPYNASPADLLGLQDDIAVRVAEALEIKMSEGERARIYRRYTQNAQAYSLFIEGRSHLVRNRKEDTRAAVDLFRRALDLDARYALAHAGLGMAGAQMRLFFAPEDEVASWEALAQRSARRAVDLDDSLAEAHEALAAVYRSAEFDWNQAIQESTRALELNPSLDLPHLYRASAFSHLGLLERVSTETRTAMDINPANRAEPLRVEGVTALFAGKFGESVAVLEEARQASGRLAADWNLAQAYYHSGRRQEAEAMLAGLRGSARSERRAQATLASFLAARGDRSRAETLVREVVAGTYMDHHVAYALGAAHAQLGNGAEAVRWLKQAADTGFPCYPWFDRDPLLAPLRQAAAFRDLLADLRSSWQAAVRRHGAEP